MSFGQIIVNRVIPSISLSKFDEAWQKTLYESTVFAAWQNFRSLCQKNLTPLSGFATILEYASLLMVALLFFVLPAPQFAEDKGILALLVLFACALRVLASLFSGKFAYRPCAVDAAVLAFLAMNIISTASSHYLDASIKGLSKMAVYFCSYFLFVSVLQRSGRNRTLLILLSMLMSGLAVSLLGVDQYRHHVAPLATWEDPTIEDQATRVYSTLRNPNLLAGYLVPLIPLACGLAITGFCRTGWRRILGLPALAVAAIIVACCIFTGSRGGYLGIGAGMVTLGLIWLSAVWVNTPRLRPWLVLVVVVMPALFLLALHFAPSYEHRVLSIFAGREHSSNSYRLNVYSASLKMFLDNWWLGVGPGNNAFKLAYGLYMRSGFDALGTYCVPLEVAVETGVLGLLAFSGLVVSALMRAHENFWAQRSSQDRWIIAAAAAAIIGMMVHGLFDTVFYRPQVQFIFWLLLAFCVAGLKEPEVQSMELPASQAGASEESAGASEEAA